jgi:hypothetical protein
VVAFLGGGVMSAGYTDAGKDGDENNAWSYTTREQRRHEQQGNVKAAQQLRNARWFLFPNGPKARNWGGKP